MEFHFEKPVGLDDQGCCETCGGLVMEALHRGVVWPGPCTCHREWRYVYGVLETTTWGSPGFRKPRFFKDGREVEAKDMMK